jgi:hypothetical protein
MPRPILAALAAMPALLLAAAGCGPPPRTEPADRALFNGRNLDGWHVPDAGAFRGRGEVRVADGAIHLDPGRPLTGVAWGGAFPRSNYEVQAEVRRTAGADFFCGMTFPVGEAHCTWIVGGWGGAVVGLSNVDGASAAANPTTGRRTFETGRWYRLRLRVTDARVACFIDGEPVIDQGRAGHAFGIWPQQQPCRPFGIAAYLTGSAVRSVVLREKAD